MTMSRPTRAPLPLSRSRFLANSRMGTGRPISSIAIPPLILGRSEAWRISCTASGIVMKKRLTSSCVTVRGSPASIWLLKSGITLPLLPKTLPKRTTPNAVFGYAVL